MRLNIIIPLYNDWDSFVLLAEHIISSIDKMIFNELSFTVVNDGSTVELPKEKLKNLKVPIEVLHLTRNLGHQRAIAIGLAHVSTSKKHDAVIVMDSDGEDRPEDISKLVNTLKAQPDKMIFAKRAKRGEGFIFKFFYGIYKLTFKLLTGKSIAFGNFCIIPSKILYKVVALPEIWNHFSGGIMRSKIDFSTLPLDRGKRLAGNSKMNFTSLVLHGLSAVAVYMDIASVRLLIVSVFFIFISILGIITVSSIKLFTPFAIPGWASSVIIGTTSILMQAILISLFLTFLVLNYRMQKLFIPAKHYGDYLDFVETI